MIIHFLLVAIGVAVPAAPVTQADPPRLCSRLGSVHVAYNASGSPVFGSDGLTCTTVKPGGEDVRPSAGRGKARQKQPKRKRGS